MNWDSPDLPKEFKRFKQHCLFTFKGPLADKPELRQVNYLMTYMGDKGREVYSTFDWKPAVPADEENHIAAQPAEDATLDGVFGKFEAYVAPKKNEIRATVAFNNRYQQSTEKFDNFVTDLKILVKACGYQEEDRMIRDAIVLRARETVVREKCLDKGDELTLAKAIQIGQNQETAKESMKAMSQKAETNLHAIKKTQRSHNYGAKPKSGPDRGSDKKKQMSDKTFQCKKCGRKHKPRSCPAWGTTCKSCGQKNHWLSHCPSAKKVDHIDAAESTFQAEDFFVDALFVDALGDEDEEEWILPMKINNTTVSFKLDTGAGCNVLPVDEYKRLKPRPEMKRTEMKIRGYTGTRIPIIGTCMAQVTHKSGTVLLPFHISKKGGRNNRYQPVLGLKACKKLELVKAIWNIEALGGPSVTRYKILQEEFGDVFEGLGCLPGEHKINIDKEVIPVKNACRKVPFPIREKLKAQLDKMEQMKVIAKIDEPTDWVHAMVTVVKKDGNLRICLDPRDLNKAVKREDFKLPSREEMMAQFADAKYFSKLDAYSGFWQIKLDEESSKLCTFITPFARYRFLRLPFGISMAPEAFHRKIHCLFEDLDGVDTMMDDFIVWGATREEHDERLRKVLEKCRSVNLKLNLDKCQFGVNELTYLGDVLSDKGIKPDPKKTEAIHDMPRPECKGDIQRFLGMVNYQAKFIPDVSAKAAPLRALQENQNEWLWGPEQESAWNDLRTTLTTSPVLKFYDPKKPTKISADASQNGLGAVLLQQDSDGWSPVAYASKAMTDAETRYAQIEKECLALTVACERFHQFVHGMTFVAETDHKPLVSIFKKPLADSPLRLQRMRIRLQKYDFNLIYTPGKELFTADALSRAFDQSESAKKDPSLEEEVEAYVNAIMTTLPVATTRMEEIQEETLKDPNLTKLTNIILTGWPDERRQCPPECREYWNYREELSVVQGIIFKGDRIVVPSSMHKAMLEQIHKGHLGIEKCKRRARDVLYWPRINLDIETMVQSCPACIGNQRKQQAEPMKPHKVPDRPWEKVGVDLFTIDGRDYVAMVDYYSQYIEISTLTSNTTSKAVINAMKSNFARHGTPMEVISDNGPQFTSQEFVDFKKVWDFKHTTSSPHYPASNGQAENAVKQMKSMIRKVTASKEDIYLALQIYRSTPLEHGKSPAELLFNRRIRSNLPIAKVLLGTLTKSSNSTKKMKNELKRRQKANYDKKTAFLAPLKVGDPVRVQNMDKPTTNKPLWSQKGVILEVLPNRSYKVKTTTGEVYRRNRRHLMKTTESTLPEESDEEPVANQQPSQATNHQPSQASESLPAASKSPATAPVRRSSREVKLNPKYYSEEYTA